jgi:two-component system, chemotaxis family, chemotaxis protein CheY
MNKRALVVDDVPFNRMLAMVMLQREGWEAEEAEDGEDALAKLEGEHGYSLVLLDIKMPGMSGEEVCQTLRSNAHTASLPVVAYTAHALEEDRETYLAIGFNAVLIKPIEVATLKEVLTQVMGASS